MQSESHRRHRWHTVPVAHNKHVHAVVRKPRDSYHRRTEDDARASEPSSLHDQNSKAASNRSTPVLRDANERLRRVRRILVGYDGSDGSKRALERAISEAHDSHGRVTVLSVVDMPLDLDVPRNFGTLADISSREGQPLEAPQEVVEQLREAGERCAAAGLEANLMWTPGNPGHAIVETAKEIRAHVIVLGEHHHGMLGGLFGADVDAEVQREAGCDVILA